jgi:hypothetical protein
LAVQSYRLDTYVTDFERLERLIDARANDRDTQRGPGGDTGLVVRQFKVTNGRNAQIVEEYVFDKAIIDARQALRKQIAQELGQWTEKKEISGDGLPIMVVFKERDDGPQ